MKARDTIATGKRLIREGSMDDEGNFNGKMEALRQKSDAVAKMGTDRLVQLEQAMPLSKTFVEAHQDLLNWFQEVEPAINELKVMTINQDTVKKQQDSVKVLQCLICIIKFSRLTNWYLKILVRVIVSKLKTLGK